MIHGYGSGLLDLGLGRYIILAPKWRLAVTMWIRCGETHFGAKAAPYSRGLIRVYWILKYSKVL